MPAVTTAGMCHINGIYFLERHSRKGSAELPRAATRFVANLNVGDSVTNITNTGANGAGLASGTTASITGPICANLYAFSPDEQLMLFLPGHTPTGWFRCQLGMT